MDPLAQLKDIHLPQEIHNYPTAIGWWLLACAVIIILFIITKRYLKKRQLNKVKKAAILRIQQNDLSSDELFSTLKWACLHYFPREKVARLYGEDLAKFLISSLPEKHQENFLKHLRPALFERYQLSQNALENTTANKELSDSVIHWLSYALPPRENINKSQNNGTASQQQNQEATT